MRSMNLITGRWSDLSLHLLVLLDAVGGARPPTPRAVVCTAHIGGCYNSLCSESKSGTGD